MDANGDLFEAWCRAGEREEDAFCVVCCQTINCAFHGVTAVKRHSQSKKHLERTKQLRGPDGKLKRPAAVQAVLNFSAASTIASYNDRVTASEALFVLAVTLKGIPYSWGDTATPLYRAMFPDSKVAKDFSCSRKKVSYVVSDGLGPYFKSLVLKEVNRPSVFYSICIDETPLPEQHCQQMDIIMRYFSDAQKMVVVEHLQSFRLNKATANDLLRCVNEAIESVPSAGFFAFFSDGPNVMKSLKNKLIQQHGPLIDIGECSLHKVHNAFSRALDSFGSEVETVVNDVYYYFKHSAAQCGLQKEQQQVLGLPEAIFLRHVNWRWLSLVPAVDRLLEQIDALKSVLSANTPVRAGGNIAKRLRSSLNDKTLCAKALFVKNAGELLTRFLKLFQGTEPLLHILYDEMVMLLKKNLGKVFKDRSVSGKVRQSACIH